MIIIITISGLLTIIISLAVMFISSVLAKKTYADREKNSPFECGFDPKGSARLPFSLRFFLIAVIFLIFDVEITLLLPIAPIMSVCSIDSWIFTSTFFLIILLLGLYHEWNQGALEWSE
uniref:NADH-ubiquinone oxidoreductase chain 3 n=1 Tax=Typhlatya monae TaxID=1173212 RepID=A0A1Z2R733_9EUCA|nr:NADH dehydrogenase subunit 3 [Typhlatya monae]ASA39521.1 NADH dehydrogenase subunit 3 [Typhlatya monae]